MDQKKLIDLLLKTENISWKLINLLKNSKKDIKHGILN